MAELEVENKKAEVKAAEVAQVTEACVEQKNTITIEKADAQAQLAAALPALEKAKSAVNSIKQSDIVELKKFGNNALDTCRLIMDTVNILFQDPLIPVTYKEMTILKQQNPFIADSFEEYSSKKFLGPLLQQLLTFSENEKDFINEETVELLEPYLLFKSPKGEEIFTP